MTGCGDGSSEPQNGSGAETYRLPLERLDAVLFDLATVSEQSALAARHPPPEVMFAEAAGLLGALRRSGVASGVIVGPAGGCGIDQLADLVLSHSG